MDGMRKMTDGWMPYGEMRWMIQFIDPFIIQTSFLSKEGRGGREGSSVHYTVRLLRATANFFPRQRKISWERVGKRFYFGAVSQSVCDEGLCLAYVVVVGGVAHLFGNLSE
jgi:hypothetical protein